MALKFDKVPGFPEALENLNRAILAQDLIKFVDSMNALARLVHDHLMQHPVDARGNALGLDDINEITLSICQGAMQEYELRAKEIKKV